MRVWTYGDDINADKLFPGRYMYTCNTIEQIRPHLLEDLDPAFASEVQPGDLLFVGRNFACGSSREQPAIGLRGVGVAAVVGCSFARIFQRSSVNQGLVLLECPDAVEYYEPGMEVELRLDAGELQIADKVFTFPALPPALEAISQDGGLLEHARKKLEARERA